MVIYWQPTGTNINKHSPLIGWYHHKWSFKSKYKWATRTPASALARLPSPHLRWWKNYLCWRWDSLLTPAPLVPSLEDQFHVNLFRLMPRPPGPQLSRNWVLCLNSRQLSKYQGEKASGRERETLSDLTLAHIRELENSLRSASVAITDARCAIGLEKRDNGAFVGSWINISNNSTPVCSLELYPLWPSPLSSRRAHGPSRLPGALRRSIESFTFPRSDSWLVKWHREVSSLVAAAQKQLLEWFRTLSGPVSSSRGFRVWILGVL